VSPCGAGFLPSAVHFETDGSVRQHFLQRVFLQLLFARPVPQLEQATFIERALSVNAPDFLSTCMRQNGDSFQSRMDEEITRMMDGS
jgi:hypothetical protein